MTGFSVERLGSVEDFLEVAGGFLAEREAENILAFGVASAGQPPAPLPWRP